jgi:YjbE family integral membrane protein
MEFTPQFFTSLLQIIWIDLLLSGDNALVIALACRNLPPEQRKMGIFLGTGAAIGLRIIFAVIISYLLKIPFIQIFAGVLLLWVAAKLIFDEAGHHEMKASTSLWGAVKTIAIADAVMSLDNVLAVSAAAKGSISLFIFGIVFSIPLILYGADLILKIITRFPIIVWLGAALLGWIAGDMISKDPLFVTQFGLQGTLTQYLGDTIGALFVLALGFFIKWRKAMVINK